MRNAEPRMKSGKQRRTELDGKRIARVAKAAQILVAETRAKRGEDRGVVVNSELLAPNNSYGVPEFVSRGYYIDEPFACVDCNKAEIWTAGQQKWWYEVAKGYAYSTALRCRNCRRKERERKAEARRVHLEGISRKKAKSA